MATKYFTLHGTVNWAKVQEPVENYGKDGKEWTIQFYPDDWKEVKATGTQKRAKKDDQGNEYITLTRPTEQVINNEQIIFEKPSIIGPDGEAFTNLIGNGSKVAVRVAVYATRKGNGTRLEGIVVKELVKYEGGDKNSWVKDVVKGTGADANAKPVNAPPF